jgi:cell division protein FtsQ
VTVKARSDRNFRRAHVKPGRGRVQMQWLTWRAARALLIVALVTFGVYRAGALVLNARVLRVNRITIQGNVHLSRGEVEQLAHGLYGTHILRADLNAYRRALLGSPWIADAALRRVLPSTIEVFVSERDPFGICRLGGQVYLIDRSGIVIDEFGPQYAEFDLPIIDGLVVPPRSRRVPREGRPAIDPARVAFASRVIESLSSDTVLARRVSQIDVSDTRDAVVLLDDDTALLHLGNERFRERLQAYVEVAAALRDRVPDIDYVDLRFEERVYVRPQNSHQSSVISRRSVVSR